MTAYELIKQLETYPPDSKVVLYVNEYMESARSSSSLTVDNVPYCKCDDLYACGGLKENEEAVIIR